ncbi:Type II secretion system protein G precursor [compost metagenome]
MINMQIRQKQQQQLGFTIVELLIVIVIIGILAAITIVAYNGIQNRANDTTIKSDLANIAKQLETIKAVSSSSTYPTTTELASNKLSASKNVYEKSRNNLYYCRTTDNLNYAVGAVSTSGKNFFLVNGVIQEGVNVWGSTTCDQLTSFGTTTNAGSGYDNPTNTWSPWVK